MNSDGNGTGTESRAQTPGEPEATLPSADVARQKSSGFPGTRAFRIGDDSRTTNQRYRSRLMLWHRHIALMLLAGAVPAVALAFPWLMSNLPGLGVAVSLFFSQLCHQDPARSFAFAGIALPVCARCLALYIGGFLGMAGYPLFAHQLRRSQTLKWLLAVSFVLMLLDAGLDRTGIWRNTFLSRSASGALFGTMCGVLVSVAIQQRQWQGSPFEAEGRRLHDRSDRRTP